MTRGIHNNKYKDELLRSQLGHLMSEA